MSLKRGYAVLAAAALWLLAAAGCNDARIREAAAMTGGNPAQGRTRILGAGCGSCHTIPGIAGAHALVGPPLRGIASRHYIGGVLPNNPENLVRWLLDPRAHSPQTVMPSTGLEEIDARHIAAYLYTLRE